MKSALVSPAAQSQTLDLIRSIHPGKIRLDGAEFAALIGITPASVRTLRSRGTLDIQSQSNGKTAYFDIRDVAEFLDKQRTPKPKRGAPTKAARMEKARAAKNGGAV